MRTRSELQIEKENRALELRRTGASYRTIAAEIGWRSPQAAKNAFEKALGREPVEGREEMRRLEAEKMDAREQKLWGVIRATHYVPITSGVKAGGIVNGPDDEPLVDDMPLMAADKGLDRIAVRRAAMFGLDEPRKSVVHVVTDDVVDDWIAGLEADLAKSTGSPDRGVA